VPVPDALNDEQRGYWSKFIMRERDVELAFKNLPAEENRPGLEVAEYSAYYNGFEFMGMHLDRAVGVLDAEQSMAEQGSDAWLWLKDQRDRIEVMKRHRHRTEDVFPGVGEWNFDEPNNAKSGEIVTADEADPA